MLKTNKEKYSTFFPKRQHSDSGHAYGQDKPSLTPYSKHPEVKVRVQNQHRYRNLWNVPYMQCDDSA